MEIQSKFNQLEDMNGLRMPWHVWSTNRIDAVSCSIPIGALYTPLKPLADREPLPYEPVCCRTCHCALNSYCQVDYGSHVWTCPICQGRNQLPQSYHEISPERLPAELHQEYTTVEYTLQSSQEIRPVFLFVVDTCATAKEHDFLKSRLLEVASSLPHDALIGFMTYGSLIYVHELTESEFPVSYVFSGNKVYSVPELRQLLSIGEGAENTFFAASDAAEIMLMGLIDKLEVDSAPVPQDERSQRCTGAALHMATRLIESLFPQTGGHILLFTSGPITKGPGTMTTMKKREPVRQHADIEKNKAPLTTSSLQFFTELSTHASENGIVINYLSAAFEETGLYEVEPCIMNTGGWLISCESWSEENVSQTLSKYFADICPKMGSNATISIKGSKNFKVSGCIGPCTSLQHKGNGDMISEKPVGNGGTTEWRLCGVLPSTTLAFFMDVAASKADPVPNGSTAFMQFMTRYRDVMTGVMRLRVTTHAVRFADLTNSFHLISQSFDQEAATVLLARHSMWKVREDDISDVIRGIDRTLIRFCRKFGTYNKGDAQSFSLGVAFSTFPQFLYHFRRSPFMATFNSSPDLTTSLRHSLLQEEVTNSLFMIQPTLLQYKLDSDARPVILDTSSLEKSCVLLLDTFFRVLVWVGSDIVAWRNAGYHTQPEYANVKAVLEAPEVEAKLFIDERFPTPLYVVCDQDSGKARFLLTRCNPSSQSYAASGGIDSLGTDEPSFSKFMMKLKEIAVTD